MSRHFAVKALVQKYNILIDYCKEMVDEDNDPISKYCLGKLTDPEVYVAVMVLNDILSELAELYCIFQQSCITTIEAVQFGKTKINKFKAQYLEDKIHWGAEVAQLLSTYPDVD